MTAWPQRLASSLASLILPLLALGLLPIAAQAQASEVTGAFQGTVKDKATQNPIADAVVRFLNLDTQTPSARRSNQSGEFSQGNLPPGAYRITVEKPGYKPYSRVMSLPTMKSTTVVPVPVELEREATPPPSTTPSTDPVAATKPDATPPTGATGATGATGTTGTAGAGTGTITDKVDITATVAADIYATDARRSGTFSENEVATLPLGSISFTRSFDELALLLPGVAPPPQTLGGVAGPGIGSGVGSSGQFSVNGLRSRANNFTVDGSDNNDEDIGVRRQGFLALIPQPVESIREYQVTTLLAPAQYGRNLGAQVNAVSKNGGKQMHGTLYGFLNTSDLNAREFFDTTNGNAVTPLRVGNQSVLSCTRVLLNTNTLTTSCPANFFTPLTVRNQSGGKDSSTLGHFGAAFGGPMPRFGEGNPLSLRNVFYFISAEGQILNAVREASFAVPTVQQRGLFDSGATGIFTRPFRGLANEPAGERDLYFPTTGIGDAAFSFFPFPNNPGGVYGENTFTQTLPASAEGYIASGKIDSNFDIAGRSQSFTARYNFTQDLRLIPVTGGALFSTLRPDVRTQNISTFLNSELSAPNAVIPISNLVRLSYGRTRLVFEDKVARDGVLQLPSTVFPGEGFLLNAPLLQNLTTPNGFGAPNTGPVIYGQTRGTTEDAFGPIGQINISGFSPVGIDVFNFPQRRVNNTYQVADTLTLRVRGHSLAFGADVRRSELNSDLPRNSRPLITFNGLPRLDVNGFNITSNGQLVPNSLRQNTASPFIRGIDLASASITTGFLQTFATRASAINLRYHQFNFFGQDEWRVRPNVSLSYGLRYEYNTPPREINRSIETTFNDSGLSAVSGLQQFIAGRTKIFDPDRNNFAPRVGLVYSPTIFGPNRATVIRGGYGIFYDQILGAVVSQSRNVFPNFLTVNLAGGGFSRLYGSFLNTSPYDLLTSTPRLIDTDNDGVGDTSDFFLGLFRPLLQQNGVSPLAAGSLNTIRPGFRIPDLVRAINLVVTGQPTSSESVFGATLPAKNLDTPLAHQFTFSIEQQLTPNLVASAAYVGTLGRSLLRFTTPNLGLNEFAIPLTINTSSLSPDLSGLSRSPGTRLENGQLVGGRPVNNVGVVNIFETKAKSRYDSLQVQLRGRLSNALLFQLGYTFSKVIDDVSDVFDLAGASALPQNSLTFAGERAPANFDVTHRVAYGFVYSFPTFTGRTRAYRALLGGLELAGTGQLQTGQPFTVNSIFDVNLDGNLTDRLNSTASITYPVDRSQTLAFSGNPTQLLAAPGSDGRVGRNTFRGADFVLLNLALSKKFAFTDRQSMVFRAEFFNFLDYDNFAIPVRFLGAPGFGRSTETVTPGRRIQFALKYSF